MEENPRPLNLMEVAEGETTLLVPSSDHVRGPKARTGAPFYNPAMRLARDLSVLILQRLAPAAPRTLEVCDAMSSLGARGLRLAREVPNVHVLLNDPNVDAIHLAKRNADRLGLRNVDFRMGRLEPLLADHRFDWVDIDPFGTPAPYLDAAAASVRDGGILAVTATDKAALCGVYPAVCERRYNARSLRGPVMWETATRILVAAVARAAGRRDRSIEPVVAHSSQHYVRVYVRVRDGSADASQQALEPTYAWIGPDLERRWEPRPPPEGNYAGPLWAGRLHDGALLEALQTSRPPWAGRDVARLLALLLAEHDAPPLYYTIDEFTRRGRSNAPRLERFLERLRAAGYRAARTHFTPRGFKTDAPPGAVQEALASGPQAVEARPQRQKA